MHTVRPSGSFWMPGRPFTRRRQTPSASSISIRQWSLGPHSSDVLRARTFSERASSVEAKTGPTAVLPFLAIAGCDRR